MRSSTLFTSLLFATSVWAGFGFSTGDQAIITKDDGDDLSVPGDNPLSFCSETDDDILTIDGVDLDPNPPVPGQTLNIYANGTLNGKVDTDARVHLQVKYGLITLINQEASLCDYVSNVDLECPLEKGDLNLTKSVDLPREIPPGKYTVLADVFTEKGDKITCLTATIAFRRG